MATVSLVLGSGGARGYAHIGVIEVLEEHGYTINCVAGSSMGALVGGLYAAGALADYADWAKTLNRFNVIAMLDITFKMGAIRGDKLFNKLRDIAGDPAIESLPIAFTAVATDLVHHKEVWFQRGSLQAAIRASVAVPGVFTPVEENRRVLVDGGILNPLPIIPTVAAHSDLIIAVDLNGQGEIPNFEVPQPSCPVEITDGPEFDRKVLREFAERQEAFRRSKLESNIDILMGSIEVMQGALSQYKVAGYPPDLLISIPADTCRFHDFHLAKEVIEAGRKAAEAALVDLENQSLNSN